MFNPKLNKSFRKLDRSLQKKRQELSGELGAVINGLQLVEVPNRPGFHYVQLNVHQNELIQAFNDKTSPLFGLHVLVRWNINRYEVIGKDNIKYSEWNSNYLPKHGNQHSHNAEGGGGGDVSYIYGKQFVPLALVPSGAFGAPVGLVSPYSQQQAGWHYIDSTPTPNIVNHKPLDNQARMVLVALDWNTRTPQIIIGTGTFPANLTGSSDVIPYLPTTTGVYQIPIAGVRLVSGTQAVLWNNIYDVRQYFHPIFTGTSSGGGGSGGTGSVPVGSFYSNTTDTVLNGASKDPINLGGTNFNDNLGTLSGNKVTVTEAGKYNILLNVGYSSASGTIKNGNVKAYIQTTSSFLYDEDPTTVDSAVLEGETQVETVAQLAAGEQVWASIDNNSGGTLNVSVGELSIFQIGVGGGTSTVTQAFSVGMMGWDEGVPLGTGTVFNFVGAGVTASLSGTVFNISVTGSPLDTATLDTLYLRLDTSNDPLTGRLLIEPTIDGGGQFGVDLEIPDTASPYTPIGMFINNQAGVGLYDSTESNQEAAVLTQLAHTGTTVSTSTLLVFRSPYDTSDPLDHPNFTEAMIFAQQDRGSGTISGGLLRYRSDNVDRVEINPSVQGTGTVAYIDTDFQLSHNGTLLSLKNKGVSRMYVNASGTVFSNEVPLIKEAPADGLIYGRKNNGWVLAPTGTSSGGGTASPVVVYDDSVFVATGTILSFNTNLNVYATGTTVFVEAPITTYFRVGQPTTLSSPTGFFWRVPDRVYASGSLGVFNNGHALVPGIDYQEQLWVSGTYQYLIIQPTGTNHLVHYGVPCSPQTQPSTGTSTSTPYDLQDSDSVDLQDSDGIQLQDSDAP